MRTEVIPSLSLIHGARMPAVGFGTSPLRGGEATIAVRTALEVGYRLIDTAENYENEEAVGQGIRDSGVDRTELFITTKFDRRWHSVLGARQACEASVRRMGVDYIDLLLVHWPNPHLDRYVDALRGLAELLQDGTLRAIGTSNFKPAHLQRVLVETGIVPDVNQIQLSPYTPRLLSRAYHAEHGILTESWSPIGDGRYSELRHHPLITGIAARYDKSATQTILRWHVQQGLVPIPRSRDAGRIAENFMIFDFSLTDAEMAAISSLDRGEGVAMDSDAYGH